MCVLPSIARGLRQVFKHKALCFPYSQVSLIMRHLNQYILRSLSFSLMGGNFRFASPGNKGGGSLDPPHGPRAQPTIPEPTPRSLDPSPGSWTHPPRSLDPPHGPWAHPRSLGPPPGPWAHPLTIPGLTQRSLDPPHGSWVHPTVPGSTPPSKDPPHSPWSHPTVPRPTPRSLGPPLGSWALPTVSRPTTRSLGPPRVLPIVLHLNYLRKLISFFSGKI